MRIYVKYTKKERKEYFRMLLSASGLSSREAARVLSVPYATLCAWGRGSENDTTAGPSDGSLDILESISRNIAVEIIESECREEARHPLEPTELFQLTSAYPHNQNAIRLIMQGPQLAETVHLNVLGRVGPIGWIEFIPDDDNASSINGQINRLLQDEYYLLTNRVVPEQTPSELARHSQWRFQTVKRILGLTNVELARMFSTSVTTISNCLSDRNRRHPDIRLDEKVRRMLLDWAIAAVNGGSLPRITSDADHE